ncbi:MAG: GNAT family N-acetyltransferase [bacterium]
MNWHKIIQFEYKNDEERTTIKPPYGLTETMPIYEFADDLTEEELKNIKIDENDLITKIEHIEVNLSYRNKGYSTKLMKEALKEASKRNAEYIYLNASPMGFDGLSLNELTNFYEKFGFNVIKEQDKNNLMWRKL